MALTTAHADVSDNLVFCSKLSNSRERIACYDAAARIAGNPPSRSSLRAASSTDKAIVTRQAADTGLPAFNPAATNAFEGFYVAAGGGYGVTGPRSIDIFTLGFGNRLVDTVYSNGWSVSGVAGYNVVVGRWLFGLEFDGRFSNERGHAEQVNVPFFGGGTEFLAYDIKSDAGVHLAARIGATFDNTLIFAKFGVGASHIVESSVSDGRAITCPPFTCQITLLAGSKSVWVPSYLFGMGVEQNFGAFFIRAQGELEVVHLQESRFYRGSTAVSDLYWTARAMAAVGVRF